MGIMLESNIVGEKITPLTRGDTWLSHLTRLRQHPTAFFSYLGNLGDILLHRSSEHLRHAPVPTLGDTLDVLVERVRNLNLRSFHAVYHTALQYRRQLRALLGTARSA